MQAEVWKREQEKAHEERKLEEMRKEIAEERKMRELTDQAVEAGHVQKVERLEFMYKGGPGMGGPGMGVPSEDADAYLLGEKKFEASGGDDALARAREAPGSLLAAPPEVAKNETWNKLNSDPLLTMRVQEQEARRAITNDPARVARARAEFARARMEKKEKKRRRKEEKKAAKRARKERIRAEVRREVLGEDAERRPGGESGRDDSRRERDEGKKRRRRRASTSSSASEWSSDSDSDSRARHRGKRAPSRSRSRSRDAARVSSRDRRSARDDRRSNRRRDDDGRDRPRSPRSRSPRSRSPRSRSPRPAALAVRDGASAQGASDGYGLTYANERGERAAAVRRERRDEWREKTRDSRDAEDEARSREAREKEARWANCARGARNTVGHVTGKMSEEERAARIAAMTSDAAAHDASRVSRLRETRSDEKSLGRLAASAPERHHSEAAPFLEKAQREAFGGSGVKGGLEDRIGTTKHYTRRGGRD